MLTFNLWVHVLIYLYNNEFRVISKSDVSKDMRLAWHSCSDLCNMLVKTRVIKLVPIKGDARKKQLVLTDNGKCLAKTLYDSRSMISKL